MSIKTRKTATQIEASAGNRHTDTGNRLCRICGKGPVPIARMTFNGEYGQFAHPKCYQKWLHSQSDAKGE